METLKKSLVVILGVLLISSFVTNVNHQPATKTELSNGEKNIELIKKLMKENEFKDVRITSDFAGTEYLYSKIEPSEISFDDIYIIVRADDTDIIYFESDKITYIRKSGKSLVIRVQ